MTTDENNSDRDPPAETPTLKKTSRKKAKKRRAPAAGTKPKRAFKAYPSVPLEKALQVAYEIKDKNGGNAWATDQVAAAVGLSPKGTEFYYLTAAARDYGITVGTRETKEISLTELGRELVYAGNPQIEYAKKVEAFHHVELFRKVLAHYKGSDLPEMKYLGNTLERDFGVPPQHHEDFSRVFRENTKYLNIKSGDAPPPEENAKSPSTVVVGEPSGRTGLKAFVIMPFTERSSDRPKGFFEEVLRSLITPAALEAGFKVETANRQGSDVIQSTIVNDLLESDLVIADLTDHNPNVLFELGLRMAEDKPVALIKAVGTGRVFDVDNMLRVKEYQPNLWRSTVDIDIPELAKHFQAAWENRDTDMTYLKILRRGASGGDKG